MWKKSQLLSVMKVDRLSVSLSLCLSYQPISAAVSTAVKGSFLYHLWYLCPELVVLAMFDREVPNAEKATMAQALLQHPVPDAFAPGKPGGRHFEQITPKLTDFIAGRGTGTMSVNFHHWQELALLPLGWKKSRRVVSEGTGRNKTLITLSCLKLQGICLQ